MTKRRHKPVTEIMTRGTTMQKILGKMRRAIEDYEMLHDNDRIALGISGGKDSLIMLIAFSRLKKFLPVKFELEAVTIDLGFKDFNTEPIRKLCQELEVNYTVEKTNIFEVVSSRGTQGQASCSFCANMRRGALDNAALKLNCTKVALAHHNDDVINTSIMSLFYTGSFHTFGPVTWMDRKKLHVIRPMIYVKESEIADAAASISGGLTIVKNPCPNDSSTSRAFIKDTISDLQKKIPDIKSSIFSSIKDSGVEGWHR